MLLIVIHLIDGVNELDRRGFITGLVALVAAPTIVRASSLMPIKVMKPLYPVMDFKVERIMVTAQSRTLSATYTVEFAQDLEAIYNLDARTEITNMLTEELNRGSLGRVGILGRLMENGLQYMTVKYEDLTPALSTQQIPTLSVRKKLSHIPISNNSSQMFLPQSENVDQSCSREQVERIAHMASLR